MRKERKIKIITITALIVAIIGLTVAFAALSQVLQINGTATVESANWDIHIENVQLVEKLGDATYTEPTIEGTKLKDFVITLRKPGDSVKFSFDVKNGGDIDAYLDSALTDGVFFNCLAGSANYSSACAAWDLNGTGKIDVADLGVFVNMFIYDVYFTDTHESLKKVVNYDDLEKLKLMHGESKNITVEVTYLKSATELLKEQAVLIDNTTPIELTYMQYNSEEWED